MIYIKLDKNIDANKLLKEVENLIKQQKDVSECILKVEVCKITQESNEQIPKLEYKVS